MRLFINFFSLLMIGTAITCNGQEAISKTEKSERTVLLKALINFQNQFKSALANGNDLKPSKERIALCLHQLLHSHMREIRILLIKAIVSFAAIGGTTIAATFALAPNKASFITLLGSLGATICGGSAYIFLKKYNIFCVYFGSMQDTTPECLTRFIENHVDYATSESIGFDAYSTIINYLKVLFTGCLPIPFCSNMIHPKVQSIIDQLNAERMLLAALEGEVGCLHVSLNPYTSGSQNPPRS